MRVCSGAPRHIRAEYLICRWLDSYALRFSGGTVADAGIPAFAPKFIPTTFPPSGAHQKCAATCDILSYSARYGICNTAVLEAVERIVINTVMCGNICQLHGIFLVDGFGCSPYKPTNLACLTAPERLVRTMRPWKDDALDSLPAAHRDVFLRIVGILMSMVPDDMATSEKTVPLPTHDKLELLMHLVLTHHASPNSHQGFLLAMSVYAECTPLMCFMLACGADPKLRNGIALHIAVKKGWVSGLRLLVERDDRLETRWRNSLRSITHEMHTLSRMRNGSISRIPRRPLRSNKRQRLTDRCQVDVSLLNAAVRAEAWDLVNYLMNQKGLVPDVDTLSLIDRHGGSM